MFAFKLIKWVADFFFWQFEYNSIGQLLFDETFELVVTFNMEEVGLLSMIDVIVHLFVFQHLFL